MALIPPFFIDCVVAIGERDQKKDVRWMATGFLYGYYLMTESEQKERKLYRTYLVTNRHVLDGLKRVMIRFNPKSGEPAKELGLNLVDGEGSPIWSTSPDPEVDIAVVPLNFKRLEERGLQVSVFQSDVHAAPVKKLVEIGASEGDFVYVLGFPMGIVGGERSLVIVRGGTIARIRDTLDNASRLLLVDASIFPGNSGGPVVSKPETVAIEGTKEQDRAYLIGIVRSYQPYIDIAFSQQTRRPRVVFEENSDLAEVHTVDCIDDAVKEHMKTLGTVEAEATKDTSAKPSEKGEP